MSFSVPVLRARKQSCGVGIIGLMFLVSAGLLAGCGGMVNDAPTGPVQGAALQGNVHGGQNPVAGATIKLYAAQSSGPAGTGYGQAAQSLLTNAVTTGSDGSFSISGDYNCPASPNDQVISWPLVAMLAPARTPIWQ